MKDKWSSIDNYLNVMKFLKEIFLPQYRYIQFFRIKIINQITERMKYFTSYLYNYTIFY